MKPSIFISLFTFVFSFSMQAEGNISLTSLGNDYYSFQHNYVICTLFIRSNASGDIDCKGRVNSNFPQPVTLYAGAPPYSNMDDPITDFMFIDVSQVDNHLHCYKLTHSYRALFRHLSGIPHEMRSNAISCISLPPIRL